MHSGKADKNGMKIIQTTERTCKNIVSVTDMKSTTVQTYEEFVLRPCSFYSWQRLRATAGLRPVANDGVIPAG